MMLLESVGWLNFHPSHRLEKSQAQTGLENSVVFVAENNGNPVGITRIVTDGGYIAIIADVIVHPDYQGKGIGRALMQRAVDSLVDGLPAGSCINISVMSAKGKEGFYEKFGFVKRPNEVYGNGMSLFYNFVTPGNEGS